MDTLIKDSLVECAKGLYSKASKHNMKTRHIYRKILGELNKIDTPLTEISQLRLIKNIGPKTLETFKTFIKDKIENEKNEEKIDVYRSFISEEIQICNSSFDGIMELKDILDEKNINDNKMENLLINIVEDSIEKIDDDGVTNNKRYVPAFRSGAYAILNVLRQEDGLNKHQIALRGQQYSDTTFDLHCRYSAWSSMKTLLKKGLVSKENKKYFLTDIGISLTNDLFKDLPVCHIQDELDITDLSCLALLIDSREIKHQRDRTYFQRCLEKSMRTETRNLELGDFLWITRINNVEYVLDYIIERKCGSDFCSSISDGRFKEQKQRLRESGIKNVIYIIEGLRKQHMNSIGVNNALSCITQTKLEGFTVIETGSIEETVEVIKLINREIQTINRTIKGVNFERFVDRSNKTMTLKQLFYRSLLSIKFITHAKAEKIADIYKSFYEFYQAWLDGTLISVLENVEADGKLLGRKCAELIVKTFFNVY
ncbi:Crossover junction endonuclease MUS81 [Astathelohania contejeani]|uniref:Crossover junction endonuclease MUS81 n=1 Tax=Astathelohania contejeani TaxID=164912 RepID=A0ABQ7I136_9MICR|nr:Crossover junction endonuclease MUS81 [Thelohania contejeani]